MLGCHGYACELSAPRGTTRRRRVRAHSFHEQDTGVAHTGPHLEHRPRVRNTHGVHRKRRVASHSCVVSGRVRRKQTNRERENHEAPRSLTRTFLKAASSFRLSLVLRSSSEDEYPTSAALILAARGGRCRPESFTYRHKAKCRPPQRVSQSSTPKGLPTVVAGGCPRPLPSNPPRARPAAFKNKSPKGNVKFGCAIP